MAVNKTVVLDSNIIIYSGLVAQNHLRQWLKSRTLLVSTISQLEVLGYRQLTPKDQYYFEAFFEECELLSISEDIIQRAIEFRREKRMSLGDTIIAATALQQHLPLVTANTKDFNHIAELDLINPFQE